MSICHDKASQPISLDQLIERLFGPVRDKPRIAFVLRNMFRMISAFQHYAKHSARLEPAVCWVGEIGLPEQRNEFYRVSADELADYFTSWITQAGREFITVSTILGDHDIESDAAIFFAPMALLKLFTDAGGKHTVPPSLPSIPFPEVCQTSNDKEHATPSLSHDQRAVMAARLAFVREVERQSLAVSQQQAILHLVDLAESGRLNHYLTARMECANDRKGVERTLSERTLKRWLAAYRRHGAKGLAPVHRKPNMNMPDWGVEFLECYWRMDRPVIKTAYESFARNYSGDYPSLHQVRSFLKKLKARF